MTDIKHTIEEVVHSDKGEERGSSSAAVRSNLGGNAANKPKIKKSRSRSLYVAGDIHSARPVTTDSAPLGAAGRKRSSSSAKALVGLRRDMML